MKYEKTFEAIDKLKEIEIELHRLKNALEMTNRALDAKSEWVGLTDEEIQNFRPRYKFSKELLKEIETILKEKNT